MISILELESKGPIDQTILITGASSGIGYEASLFLAGKGAHILMAVRSMERGSASKEAILKVYPKALVSVYHCELEDLKTVHQLSKTLKEEGVILDALINNAGIMMPKQGKTNDGFERQIGINHLGHFALTGLLMPLLKKNARVVNVSSQAHLMGKINLDDIHLSKSYKPFKAYAQSKLANALFTEALKHRFKEITPITIHPGVAKTNLFGNKGSTPFFKIMGPIFSLMASSAHQGSLPIVAAVIHEDIEKGAYIGPKARKNKAYLSLNDKVNPLVYNKTLQNQLWELSECLTNVTY
jgi:NAD(P)-dependent dehydrogenase (short-subunit alcohol dehydrogenase family)